MRRRVSFGLAAQGGNGAYASVLEDRMLDWGYSKMKSSDKQSGPDYLIPIVGALLAVGGLTLVLLLTSRKKSR